LKRTRSRYYQILYEKRRLARNWLLAVGVVFVGSWGTYSLVSWGVSESLLEWANLDETRLVMDRVPTAEETQRHAERNRLRARVRKDLSSGVGATIVLAILLFLMLRFLRTRHRPIVGAAFVVSIYAATEVGLMLGIHLHCGVIYGNEHLALPWPSLAAYESDTELQLIRALPLSALLIAAAIVIRRLVAANLRDASSGESSEAVGAIG
jgi:hypothetical protein